MMGETLLSTEQGQTSLGGVLDDGTSPCWLMMAMRARVTPQDDIA
jgi:hypothetical protein